MGGLAVVHAVRSDGFAGVERHVATLAAAQAAAGHEVAVVGGDPALMRATLATPGVRHRSAITVLETAQAIDSWRRCDILHVHMTAAEMAAVMAVRSWPVPVVSTRHFGGRRGASWSGRLAVPLVARRIAAQIAISRYVAELIEGASTVVHPGVPRQPDATPSAQREQRVLVAQRLEEEKATEVAVRAFALSGLATQGWRLELAGHGSQRGPLEQLATQLGVAQVVEFLGHRADVPELMKRAGLLLAPCPIEGLGLTVLEAMAAGLPVVAARAGGHLETLGAAEDPALFPSGDAAAAAGLLSRLAADVAGRLRYGTALQALQRQRFTPEAQAEATDGVYRSVL